MFFIGKDMLVIKETVVRIEENLKEHMRRTANLEGRMDSQEQSSSELKGAIKLLGLILTVVSIGAALVAIFRQ